MEQFLKDSPLVIITTDHRGFVYQYNTKATLYFGRILAKNIQDLFAPDSQFNISEMLEAPCNTTHKGYFQKQHNQIFFADVSKSQTPKIICWYILDQQKHVDLNNTIQQYQNIPREFSHELNNLLTVIISASELLRFEFQNEQILEDTDNILRASYRATTRIKAFMDFGRKQFLSKKILSLAAFLAQNEQLLQNCLGERHQLYLPILENEISICVPEASFRALLTHICTYLRLQVTQNSSFYIKQLRKEIAPPLSSHYLGVAEDSYQIISFTEENFPMEEQTLCTPKYISHSKDEILGQIWEASLRCGGSFLQRIAPNGRRCVTIYLPDINPNLNTFYDHSGYIQDHSN